MGTPPESGGKLLPSSVEEGQRGGWRHMRLAVFDVGAVTPFARFRAVTTPALGAPPLLNQEGSFFKNRLPSSDEEGRRDSRRGVVLTDGAVLTRDAPPAPKPLISRPVAACKSGDESPPSKSRTAGDCSRFFHR